jgi:sugar-specific transcriptional regulator TrmB
MEQPSDSLSHMEMTTKIMQSLGLDENEINIYIKSSGLGPVTIGELALLGNISHDACEKIVTRFVNLGLFKQILGPKQYFQALPPYAAILQQLEIFDLYLGTIKEEMPKELLGSFKQIEDQVASVKELDEFVNYLSDTRSSMTEKLNDRRRDIEEMQTQTKSLIELQFEGLNTQVVHSLNMFDDNFREISESLDGSVDTLKEEVNKIIEHLDDLPAKVADEKKLFQSKQSLAESIHFLIDPEITLIKSMFQTNFLNQYEKIIDDLKISFHDHLSIPFGEILEKGRDSFKEDFEVPFQGLLESTSAKVDFVLNEFDVTLSQMQGRMMFLSANVKSAFDSLQKVFLEKIVATLTDLLSKIKSKLNDSSEIVQEFWNEAKQIISITMKDVWFIRTPEGMQAQLKDAVGRSKMRLLIVAPNLIDIDFEPIFALPAHINVRICCNFDYEIPDHQPILDNLAKHVNISLRYRETENLWGINRDYEEVIVGIVSTPQNDQNISETSPAREVAGIGSSFQEHIKMLVPILEEAWMNAKKGKLTRSEATEETSSSSDITEAQEVDLVPQISDNCQEENTSKVDLTLGNAQEIMQALDDFAEKIKYSEPSLSYNDLFQIKQNIVSNFGFSRMVSDMETWVNRMTQMIGWDDLSRKTLTTKIEVWKSSLSKL